MSVPQVVIDTNVIIAGLRSRRGSAFRLLTLVGTDFFAIHLSVPLVLEYQEVLSRELSKLYVTATDIDDLIEQFGLTAVTPAEFLQSIGAL